MKRRSLFRIRAGIPRWLYASLAAGSFAILLAVWSALSYGGVVASYFLPTPSAVLLALGKMLTERTLLSDIDISFYRVMVGFTASAIVALPLGVAIGTYKAFEAALEPINDFVRYIPVPGFIPLVILWVGISDVNQITIIFLGTFFQLVLLIADSVSRVAREYVEATQMLYGNNRTILLARVIVPAALPDIYDNLRVSVGWAWSYLVLAEVVAANSGIGHAIVQAQRYLQTDRVVAGIIVVGALGLGLDFAFKLAFRVFFPWSEKGHA